MTWTGTPPSWYLSADWSSADRPRNGVFYVGDEVVLKFDDHRADSVPEAGYTSSFETGVSGEVVASDDLGCVNNFSHTQGSPVYDDTHVHSGVLSCKYTAGGQTLGWNYVGSPPVPEYFRFYIYATAFPSTVCPFIHTEETSNQANLIMSFDTAGCIVAREGGSGTNTHTFTNPIALNQWVRVEAMLDCSVKGFEVRLFNDPESLTPTESFSASGWTGFGTSNIKWRAGSEVWAWGSDFWVDDFAAAAPSWIGPLDPEAPLVPSRMYEIRNYYGGVVSSGYMQKNVFTPIAPGGGWEPGWYRCYITGENSDPTYAYSCGATNFCVIKDDAHFVTMPPGNTSGGNQTGGDFVMKGVMGLGTTRLSIFDASNYGAELSAVEADAGLSADYYSDNGIPDSERPERLLWCDFPNRGFDFLSWPDVATGVWRFYVADPSLDSSQVFVTISAGTNANTDKVRVYYPDSTTLVETYDNLANASAAYSAISGVSTKIWLYPASGSRPSYAGPTSIPTAYRDGVVASVAALYPLGVTRFEGPCNEPSIQGYSAVETAHLMRLFQEAVHAGNANAKAIGPANVNITSLVWWTDFLDAGGGSYCDEISFHAYNSFTNGNLNLGRHCIGNFLDTLDSYGLSAKVLWQTESTNVFNAVYGAYHPRRARKVLIETLFWEQNGVPRERNNWWYDKSMGFWDYPSFFENANGGLQPQVVLGRVLAEETWGKYYLGAVDFGTYGNAIYLGNVYTNAAGEMVVVMMPTSYMTGASAALTIGGTSGPVTVVDGFGNEKSMPLSKGRITIPMTEVPVYVRIPAGAGVSVYRVNGWNPLGVGSSVGPSASTKEIDGVSRPPMSDDAWLTDTSSGEGTAWPGHAIEPPSTATLLWSSNCTFERLIIWAGMCWQGYGTLVEFDVQTFDGATWTTRKTVTKDTPPYFYFGTDSQGEGCFIETYWDEQWVFDVEFDAPVTCQGVRVNITDASYGGEPLSAPDFGQGWTSKQYTLEEIAVLDSNRYAAVA